MKGVSSILLFQEFPEIKLKPWKGHLWSASYCLLTICQTTLDVLNRYVESQGKNRKIMNDVNQFTKNSCKICGW